MKLAAAAILVLACLVAAAWCLVAAAWCRAAAPPPALGGAPRGPDYAKSPHLVVDTLNLAHWIRGSEGGLAMSPAIIADTIDRTAPALRARHAGRVMYVLKDRESQFNDEAAREVYRQAAVRNRVYVLAAERYPDPPKGVPPSAEHSARGRDDFFTALLARRWRCAVLTEDRLRDFDRFRATIQPFHVYEFAFWRAAPHREFIRPEAPAYARLARPRLVRYAGYFPAPPRG
jgi:hypothetical protein